MNITTVCYIKFMENSNPSDVESPPRAQFKDRIIARVASVLTKTNPPSTENKGGFTRREFLGLVLTTAVAVSVAISYIEKAILDSLTAVLTSPGSTDRVIDAVRTVSEVDRSVENPNARPIYELIQSGIANYQGRIGREAFYKRSGDYQGKEYYSEVLNKTSRSILLPKRPDDILEEFKDSIPGDAKLAYFSSDLRITQFESVFV